MDFLFQLEKKEIRKTNCKTNTIDKPKPSVVYNHSRQNQGIESIGNIFIRT